jgi:hypothetical protein
MKTLLAIAFCASATLVLGCGKSPCDELSDLCAKCMDATTRQACSTTAASYKSVPISGQNACQAVLDQKVYASCGG